MSPTIPLAQYLFSRLRQLHCHSIHGVPGDFMLRALDYLPQSGVKWIGNANELCAGYAADGYVRAAALARRTKHSHVSRVGAVYTTYGVGELSVINAIAGAYAEHSPVVHLAGTPSRKQWRTRPCMHHTLGDGRLHIYAEMAKQVTCAQADLACEDANEAAERIDNALEECVKQSGPIYISLPSDMVSQPVLSANLERDLNLQALASDPTQEEKLLLEITQRLSTADRPLIIADGLCYPWDLVDEVNELVQLTNIPSTCFISGKGVLDEALPSWTGPLAGPNGYSSTTDLALLCGPLLSDTNTAAWSSVPDPKVSISFNSTSIDIGGRVYAVQAKPLLKKPMDRLRNGKYTKREVSNLPRAAQSTPVSPSSTIGQDALWSRLSTWLRPHDTILLANGTPLIGGRDMHIPSPVHVIASGIWTSIGSMLPAAQGVAEAKKDHAIPGRTILLEGDGSFQVTCQAISDIIRYKLDVTIFIANNAGYTYERWLNGMHAEYNDVPAWRYVDAGRFFGAVDDDPAYPVLSRRVETWSELDEVLTDNSFADGKGLKIVDVVLAPEDVPEAAKPGLRKSSDSLRAIAG